MTDQTPAAGWRKGADGKWIGAGAAASPASKQFGLTDGKYVSENERYFQGGAKRTKYYDGAERDAHRLGAADGRLVGADGAKLDTEAASSALVSGAARVPYLRRRCGRRLLLRRDGGEQGLVCGRRAGQGDLEAVHHSSLVNGSNVRAAGELTAHDGWLKMISNNSGHYRPDAAGSVQAVEALDAMGVNTDAAIVHHKAVAPGDEETHDFYNARAFAASRGDVELLDAQKEMFRSLHTDGKNLKSRDQLEEGLATPSQARARADRAEAQGQGGERYADADQENAKFGSRLDGRTASTIDARGHALSGWQAGSFSAGMRLETDSEIRAQEPKRQLELEKRRAEAAKEASASAVPEPKSEVSTAASAIQAPSAPGATTHLNIAESMLEPNAKSTAKASESTPTYGDITAALSGPTSKSTANPAESTPTYGDITAALSGQNAKSAANPSESTPTYGDITAAMESGPNAKSTAKASESTPTYGDITAALSGPTLKSTAKAAESTPTYGDITAALLERTDVEIHSEPVGIHADVRGHHRGSERTDVEIRGEPGGIHADLRRHHGGH